MNQYRTGGASYHAAGHGVQVGQPMGGGAAAAGEAWYTAGGAPTPVAAYAPIGAADLAASYVNLANPGTYNAVPVIAPTWTSATGWEFSNLHYLDTGVVPSTGWGMIVRFTGATPPGYMIGVAAAGNRFYLHPNFSSNNLYGYSGSLQIAPALTIGTIAIASNVCYANGVQVGVTTGSTIAALPILIGTINNSGTPYPGRFTGKIQALAIYNATLTGEQVAAVHDAMMQL